MGSRTVYTSTVRVPVYASWRCRKCEEVNFSQGLITCSRQASTSSMRSSKKAEAEAKAASLAQEAWVKDALTIILNPNQHPTEMRHDFMLQNTNCTKCGAKPEWDKDMRYMTAFSLCFLPAIFSGIFVFAEPSSIIAWLIFLVSLSGIIYGFATESMYKKTMANLPKRYTPVIGSLNDELVMYAKTMGKSIPDPNEVIDIVTNEGVSSQQIEVTLDTLPTSPRINAPQANYGFCRKCGAQLLAQSGFCHKCGTEIINQ